MLLTVLILSLVTETQTADFIPTTNNTVSSSSSTNISTENNTTFSLSAGGAAGEAENQTEQEHGGTFSRRFGFSDLAGLRSFSLEQQVQTRIIGGQEAWAHSWPWQISLRFASMPTCGGAIIGPTWVLSAAHCFRRYNRASFWTVLAGKHDLDNPQEAGQQLVGVSAIISHHDYNSRTKDCDVALLKLRQPLLFNRYIRPIDLWMDPLPHLTRCTVTGWGSTRENGPRIHRLQEVNVTLLPSDACNRYYSGRVRTSMFCAGKEQGGADACQGDSGGPLSCFNGARHELAGLVSWGIGCGRAGRPGVYTRVQDFARWMLDMMSHQSSEDEEELTAEGDQCGKRQQSSSCNRDPRLASLSTSLDGEVTVSNVSESCPLSWPWMVSLQSNGQHYCSGVLIHHQWVLTAKHCAVRPQQDMVVLGVHDLRFLSSQTLEVDQVFSPLRDPGFPPRADLALVRLSRAVTLESAISPVCIPEEDEDPDSSWSCITAGWGRPTTAENLDPDRLHHAGLTLINETSCRLQWGGFIQDSHICADPAGSTSCMGDSGAPLFCQKRGTYFLFGVASWGSWRCDATKPAVFTKVSDYNAWINQITEDI